MKVVVLGGYGVFGERLVRLLRRDRHQVWVAGRSLQRADTLAKLVGAEALKLDRSGDLSALRHLQPDVLIDAAGPFHAYGTAPYRLAEACLDAGINYMDLADDAGFCAGIATLDARARQRGCYALSGVSSVPAVSSSVVAELAAGLTRVDSIDSAILPGNRAPRGRSVIASILNQCGAAGQLWEGSRWRPMRGWSEPRRFALGTGKPRFGWLLKVPDLTLFPSFFGAHSVSFRAGLELGLMNRGLAALSWLRGHQQFDLPDWAQRVVGELARMLLPFGSDRGGMVVEVCGPNAADPDGHALKRTWTLLADAGDGPYVPAIAARALLRGTPPAAGARPCLAELPLAALESAMSDLEIRFVRGTVPIIPLIEQLPGVDSGALATEVRSAHRVCGTRLFVGAADIERGNGLMARMIATAFGFPPAGTGVPVEVVKQRTAEGERWERNFAGRRFRSHLSARAGRIIERFGPFRFVLGLQVQNGALHFPVLSGSLFGLPLPRLLLPRSVSREYALAGRFHFDVALYSPLGGLVVRYRGTLHDPAPPASAV